MNINKLTKIINNLEDKLVNLGVNPMSLGLAKMMLLEDEGITRNQDQDILSALNVYADELSKQLNKKMMDDGRTYLLVDKCLGCGMTRLVSEWGDWEYNDNVRFTSGYCSPECMASTTDLTIKEAYKIFYETK